jgi:hypothetical protein
MSFPSLFFERQADWFNSQAALQTIRKICAVLTNTYRINTNRSCSLYVHVGNSVHGFSVSTIQNFLAMIWTFEQQLDQIHPLHRRGNTEQCPSFRGLSHLAGSKAVLHAPNAAEKGLEILLEDTTTVQNMEADEYETLTRERTLQDFVELARPSNLGDSKKENPRGRYWIGNLAEGKKTVEFREHAAMLDPVRVGNWIQLCVGLLEFSDTVRRPILDEFLKRHIGDDEKSFRLEKVLKAVGMQ